MKNTYTKPKLEIILTDDILVTSFLFETNVDDKGGTVEDGSDFEIIG